MQVGCVRLTERFLVSDPPTADELARCAGFVRDHLPALEPGRAQVIVAGAAILREVMTAFGLGEIEASERDILHGAALAAVELS